MDLTCLKNLISERKSFYQDIEIDGQVLAKGMRETCARRWKILKPHLKRDSVIVDVGSDLGYFSTRIAEKFPDSVILSFEQNPSSVEIQKEILRVKELYNVVLCNHKLWLDDFRRWVQAVEGIDTIIFCAVLHYYEADETREILKFLSKMIPEIIIEYPQITGQGAFGGVAYLDIEQELMPFYQNIERIGHHVLGPSETRIIIKAWNTKLVRDGLFSTIPKNVKRASSQRSHKLEYKNGAWKLRSKGATDKPDYDQVKDWFVNGVSAWNLLLFNPVWPLSEWWQKEAVGAYESLLKKNVQITDIHAPNLIFTPDGLQAIDYFHKNAPFSLIKSAQEIKKVENTFKEMKQNVQKN